MVTLNILHGYAGKPDFAAKELGSIDTEYKLQIIPHQLDNHSLQENTKYISLRVDTQNIANQIAELKNTESTVGVYASSYSAIPTLLAMTASKATLADFYIFDQPLLEPIPLGESLGIEAQLKQGDIATFESKPGVTIQMNRKFYQKMAEANLEPAAEKLAATSTPSLWIAGRQDTICPPATIIRYAEAANGEYKSLNKAHNQEGISFDETSDAIQAYIARIIQVLSSRQRYY